MTDRPSKPRRILHVDVDAMFVQCAVIAAPERLAGVELILVGGSPTGRGVVTSASYGCRAFGVRSAMPMATAIRLCPEATIVRVPGPMIRTKSRELGAAIADWSPIAVMASVDEAYLDLTGTETLYRDEPLIDTARRIQADIKRRTDLDVSIGGGSNKLVAKLATSFAKPAGVFVVEPGGEEEFVARLQIGDLIGVGPAMEEGLRRRGIVSMAALRALEVETMTSWWGADRARWLWRRCRGIDDSAIRTEEATKSVSSETTFRRDSGDVRDLERALLSRVVDAAASLRKQGLFARTITVRLRDSDFRDRSRSRTLAEPVQTDRVIFAVARELLTDLRRQRLTPARLIGVALTGLADTAEGEQRTLLDLAPPLEAERDRKLSEAVDRIRGKHGRVIAPGTVLAPNEDDGTERRR
ncbi:MAG: DNA polymerase IV [Gemmatimonadota bacterium]